MNKASWSFGDNYSDVLAVTGSVSASGKVTGFTCMDAFEGAPFHEDLKKVLSELFWLKVERRA